MIRLETYPTDAFADLAGLPAVPAKLSCLLHSGILPAHHTLDVWVDGHRQRPELEEEQMVWSWQCVQDTMMEIHLLAQRQSRKMWRGWWKGGRTIIHAGTLSVQVFCAGGEQPGGVSAPSPLAHAERNGMVPLTGGSAAIAVLDLPDLTRTREPGAPPRSSSPQEEEDLWGDTQEEEVLEEPEEGAEEGWDGERETEEASPDEPGEPDEPDEPDEEGEVKAEEAEEATQEIVVEASEPQVSALSVEIPGPIAAPTGTALAGFHAISATYSVAEQERLVEQLAEVLATLPPSTILVDLRTHTLTAASSQTRRTRPQPLGLTKDLLRAQYGARYWDRGSLISTSPRLASVQPSSVWYRVVNHPSSDEAIEELVTELERGFSLLLLGSIATYAESERAAVIEELRTRVDNLTVVGGDGS